MEDKEWKRHEVKDFTLPKTITDMKNFKNENKMADSESALVANMADLHIDGPPETETAERAGLERLPNELVLKTLEHLDSARDIAALMATSRRFGPVIDGAGWPNFVRSRFGSLTIPGQPAGPLVWKQLAESLTWQSRCWDRRSLRFTASFPSEFEDRGGRRGGGSGHRSIPFRTYLDARFDLDSRQELVVWGAGQDIVARYRGVAGSGAASSWNQINGRDLGFLAGVGDVRAIKIVPGGVLAGRADGDLSLFSAAQDDSFGHLRATFSPYHAEAELGKLDEGQDWQKTIESIDVRGQKAVVATDSGPILVYDLPSSPGEHDEVASIAPSASFDILSRLQRSPTNTQARVLNAKWLDSTTMAVALAQTRHPLMYLTITPDGGFYTTTGSSNVDININFSPDDIPIFPNSISPVVQHPDIPFDTRLLLSSWRDGTIRLADIRTPSLHDRIYQDNIQPADPIGSNLLTYGTERFIGGSLDGAKIKIFDFRWSRPYHHTDGLPCSHHDPFPPAYQPFEHNNRSTGPETPPVQTCDHVSNKTCNWHASSRSLYHRPNAMVMLQSDIPSRLRSNLSVTSLAKGSDVSPNFHIGISGAVLEATLSPTPADDGSVVVDRHLALDDWTSGTNPSQQTGGYKTVNLRSSMMELGDGRAIAGNLRTILLPRIYSEEADQGLLEGKVSGVMRKKHRLDGRFQYLEDFPDE